MSELQLQAKVRDPGGAFDYYRPENPPQLTIDGFIGTTMGAAWTKIDSFRIVSVDVSEGFPVERRVHEMTLSIPTRVILEFCAAFLEGARANKDALFSALSEETRKISAALEAES